MPYGETGSLGTGKSMEAFSHEKWCAETIMTAEGKKDQNHARIKVLNFTSPHMTERKEEREAKS